MSWTPKRLIFNTLAIFGCAALTGVMLSIGLSFGGYWQSLPPDEFMSWFGQNNPYVSRPIPYMFMVSIIGLIGSSWPARGTAVNGRLWMGSIACIVAIAVVTGVYFVPQNTAFASAAVEVGEVPGQLKTWLTIHYSRIALGCIASIMAVAAAMSSHGEDSAHSPEQNKE